MSVRTRALNENEFVSIINEALDEVDDLHAVPCWPMLKLILDTHSMGYQQDK